MFKKNLNILNYTNSNGLLLVSQKDDEITETERKILYLAEFDYLADAVFFQQNENQKSIPQFFIYDNTTKKFNDNQLIEIHKRLWSSEIVPLYFVFEQSEIKIFNAKKRIDIDEIGKESISPKDILDLTKKVEQIFENKKNLYSPFLFQNGSFWETDYFVNEYLTKTITKESPFEILITNLRELKNELTANKILSEIADRIVIFCILIKYLEEKKDENGNSIFTIEGNIFQKKWNVKDFSELIIKGKFVELLNYLSEKFNGKIFELTKSETNIITNLNSTVLNNLSYFVDANYKSKNKQLYLWRLYSFRYLPVELISRIYEEFITNTKDVVYTPPFLVDFLIDECMPLEEYSKFENNKFKIIDPACGSGIFCVAAYQRLIDWYIINEYKRTKKWNKELKIETLKNILSENIFGVDLESQAVQIAVFSLTLAMLEKLTPIQLWHDLDFEDKNDKNDKKFDNLKDKNIKFDNFFNYINTATNDFDLVIGNPPFNPKKGSNGNNFKDLQKDFKLKTSFKIPDDNLALLFLDKSIELLKDGGLQCLILPSSAILYNDGAMNYRNHFLQNYFVPQIVDFTHLRRFLFNKEVSTCAFFAKKQIPEQNSQILHLISHRTAKEENKLFFVFDTYDFHFITQEVALNQKYIWKANLVGGGRLKWIVDRLSRIKPTLGEFIEKMKENNEWEYLEGYTIGEKTGIKSAHFITNQCSIPEYAFSNTGIDYSKIYIETSKLFANIRNEKIFTKPQKLIKKSISKKGIIPIEMVDYEKLDKLEFSKKERNENILCFKHGIVGIHFDQNNIRIAEKIISFLKENYTLGFYVILKGSAILLRKEKSIDKKDIDNLPYPQTEDEKENLQLSEVENIWQEDVLNYYIHQGKTSKSNLLYEELFPKAEKNLNDEKFILEYTDTFTWLMNINYTAVKEKSFVTQKITVTQSYIAVEFNYCIEKLETEIEYKSEEEYQKYFEKQIGRNKKITRVVQYIDFANDTIYFIKPRQKRYWLKSIADRDVMNCFADFGNNLI